MTSFPARGVNSSPALSEIHQIFEEACERRGLRRESTEANELSAALLNSYAHGLRDRNEFRNLANCYP